MNIDIKIPYTTKPSMVKNTGLPFIKNPSYEVINQKKYELELLKTDLYGQNINSKELIKTASKLCGKNETDDIKEFALYFEEDIAILNNGVLDAICFCFPSSWIPGKQIGKTLEQLHHPVADGEKLRLASSKIAKTISDPVLGPFKRSVWTITNTNNLSNHPLRKNKQIPENIKDLYFRLETQTTQPLLNGNSCIFFVKIDVVPLIEIWDEYKDKIIDSINSMSPEILKYKNLEIIKNIIVKNV